MFEVYKDKAKRWRWRLRARNGTIIADSGQGYRGRTEVLQAVATVRKVVKAQKARRFLKP